MDWFPLAALFTVALLASLGLSGVLRRALLRLDLLDHPNDRSSHVRPTPRGGGLAVMVVALLVWVAVPLVMAEVPPAPVPVVLAAGTLVAFFWFEDARGLHVGVRLLLQGAVAALVLFLWPGDGLPLFFQGLLPAPVDAMLAWLAWVWFMNLYNFMDGIDGISVAETVAIGLGAMLVGILTVAGEDAIAPGAILAGAILGFFWWNKPPARLFLGDVGSVPLGFVLGYILLDFAARGLWAPALILPFYYLADASLTLTHRVVRGEKIWQAHRDHFYQRAVRRGHTHGRVSAVIAGLNASLIALALLALTQPWDALAGAVLLTAATLFWMTRGTSRKTKKGTPA